ncbi:uncharacterized protein PAF06_011293 [Gastrophryne carolinensis]
MYGNVDYVPPVPIERNTLRRSPSEQSNIYLQEESIYEPIRSTGKTDPERLWRLSSTTSSEDIRHHWSHAPPKQGFLQRHKFLIAVCFCSLMGILTLVLLGVLLPKNSSLKMEIYSLKEEQNKLAAFGSFLIYNEDQKKCVEVRSSPSSQWLELTASACSADSYSQFFRWLPRGRLMSTKEGLCVGVATQRTNLLLRLYQCDSDKVIHWVCTNHTLLGVEGEQLYFNFGNNREKVVMLYRGTGVWSRWRARSLEGKLQDGGACVQCCG